MAVETNGDITTFFKAIKGYILSKGQQEKLKQSKPKNKQL